MHGRFQQSTAHNTVRNTNSEFCLVTNRYRSIANSSSISLPPKFISLPLSRASNVSPFRSFTGGRLQGVAERFSDTCVDQTLKAQCAMWRQDSLAASVTAKTKTTTIAANPAANHRSSERRMIERATSMTEPNKNIGPNMPCQPVSPKIGYRTGIRNVAPARILMVARIIIARWRVGRLRFKMPTSEYRPKLVTSVSMTSKELPVFHAAKSRQRIRLDRPNRDQKTADDEDYSQPDCAVAKRHVNLPPPTGDQQRLHEKQNDPPRQCNPVHDHEREHHGGYFVPSKLFPMQEEFLEPKGCNQQRERRHDGASPTARARPSRPG